MSCLYHWLVKIKRCWLCWLSVLFIIPWANLTGTRNVDVVAIHQWGSFGNFTKRTLFSRWFWSKTESSKIRRIALYTTTLRVHVFFVWGEGGEKPPTFLKILLFQRSVYDKSWGHDPSNKCPDMTWCHPTDLGVHLFQDKATSLAWGYNHCIEVGLRWKNFWKYPEALRYVSSKLTTYIASKLPSPLEQILPNLKQHLLFISSSLHLELSHPRNFAHFWSPLASPPTFRKPTEFPKNRKKNSPSASRCRTGIHHVLSKSTPRIGIRLHSGGQGVAIFVDLWGLFGREKLNKTEKAKKKNIMEWW